MKEVVDMIYSKAKEPLEEARRAGWGEKAQEFLLVNIADKVGAGFVSPGVLEDGTRVVCVTRGGSVRACGST